MLSIPLQLVYGLETAASSNKQNFESRYMMARDNRLIIFDSSYFTAILPQIAAE